MRSMDSILADEPSLHTLPDGPKSDSSPRETAEPKSEPVKSERTEPTKIEARTATETVVDDDDEGEEPNVDQSLEGLKKALTAVRGDKRTMRKKWREAEKRAEDTARRIAQLEGQITAYSSMGPRQDERKAEPVKGPDFYGSPEEYIAHQQKALREQFREEQFRRDATRSERRFRRDHQDYEEAKAAFVRAAQGNPQVWQAVIDDPDPAEVVYSEGKKILRGGVSESESQLRAELAELKAKVASGSVETSRAPARPIPKSIAGARGTGNGVPQAWSGPRSMKEILGH